MKSIFHFLLLLVLSYPSLNYVYGAADGMIIVTIYLNKRSTLSRNIMNGLMLSY